jgi:AcrR family transcriptional regulator
MTTSTAPRPAGRPRSSEADRAILATTVRHLVELGYDAMSIEGVAAAAGVGKATIYRRYPSKRDLVVAALSSIAATIEPPQAGDDTRADLATLLRRTFRIFERDGMGFLMLGTLLVRERDDPELLAQFRREVIGPRIAVVAALLRRGVERGEVRAGVDPEITTQMLAGAMFARHIGGGALDDDWLETVIGIAFDGIAASRPGGHQPAGGEDGPAG